MFDPAAAGPLNLLEEHLFSPAMPQSFRGRQVQVPVQLQGKQ